MCKRTIYFQRVDKFWTRTADVTLNAYLNVLRYVKMPADERLLNVASGGELPCYKEGRFEGNRIGQEENLAYTLGLYYEVYEHDCPKAFYNNVLKNLKMRISLVLVYAGLPMVCCGAEENGGALIVVGPSDGEYRRVCIRECRGADGRWKLAVLNVPGMVKMKGLGIRETVASAATLYQKRFYFFKDRHFMDMTGAAFFEHCRSTGLNPAELPGFLLHREKQLNWLYDMSALAREWMPEKELSYLDGIMQLYEASTD